MMPSVIAKSLHNWNLRMTLEDIHPTETILKQDSGFSSFMFIKTPGGERGYKPYNAEEKGKGREHRFTYLLRPKVISRVVLKIEACIGFKA